MASVAIEESPLPVMAELPSDSSVIDSALLSALRDPRERLGLLKLEQTLVDFLKSPDLFWDVGGPANSLVRNSRGDWVASGPFRPQTTFQRCLLHRLGDRFGVRREPQDDGFIRIFKTPTSSLPDQLLLNVPEKEFQQCPLPIESKPQKMKIMKRSSSSNISTGSSASHKSKNNRGSTQTDKERQYAEARARIFQQSQEEAMAETIEPIPQTPLTPSAPEFIPASDPTKPNKATWRNRQSELNDPDFQRRRPPALYGYTPQAYYPPSGYPYTTTPTTTMMTTTTTMGYANPRTPQSTSSIANTKDFPSLR